jgi:tetratricopeptide (TPR) repeat protein
MVDAAVWAAVVAIAAAVAFGGPAGADEPLPDFDELWNYGDPAATEAKFRALLPRAEKEGSPEYVAQLRTQLARTLGLQRRFDEAHALLDVVERSLSDATPVARVRFLLERGRAFNSSKQPDRARPLFAEAWDRARAAKSDGHAVDAAHMMGIVEKGDLGLDWTRKALALAESSADPTAKRWVGSLSQNLGYGLLQAERLDEATKVFETGLAWSRERKREGQVAIFRWFLGRTLRAQKRHEEALAAQRALEAEAREAGKPGDGYVFEEIAENLTALGREAEAKPYFAKAWASIGKDLDPVDDAKRIERIRRLGGVPPDPAPPAGAK